MDKGDDADLTSVENQAFEVLEKDFQEVLSDLVGDSSLEKFRLEYEKLHRALKKSHEQETKLVKKCRELNTEIVNNAAKVQTALKLSQEDQNTIASLKNEIEKAWKMVDASHEKELRAKETIHQLKTEITNLSELVEQGAGLSIGHENTVNELMKVRDELQRKNDEQKVTIEDLTDLQNQFKGKIRDAENEKLDKDAEIEELRDVLSSKNAEQERELRRQERLDKELKDIKVKLEKQAIEHAKLSEDLAASKDSAKKHELAMREARRSIADHKGEFEASLEKCERLAERVKDRDARIEEISEANFELEADSQRKEDELTRMHQQKQLLQRKLDKEKKATAALQQKVGDGKTAALSLKQQIISLEKEMDGWRKATEAGSKEAERLKRAGEISQKAVAREAAKTKAAADQVKINERTTKNLENEIHLYKQEASKQRKLIYQLEKDRERYGEEASVSQKKYLETLEVVKIKDMQMAELQKKITDSENKLKQQQQLYEAVRSDRNLYSKNLIESQDDIAEMKRKLKIMRHQIEQLKEEITSKDHALVKEHFDHQRVEKQKEQLKNELAKMKKLLEANEVTINSQNSEILKLTRMIQKMDDEVNRKKKEYEQVIAERDILGTQLIRRNDELALCYEKMKIQQSTLKMGETAYQERLGDIRILKLKITDMKRDLSLLSQKGGQMGTLEKQVHRLQRDLLQEKTKVKALSEELENPMNVHRWRKLEGSDPATYEMIQKIQTLQRRLISKTEEVVEKDLMIQEKQKLYMELKSILSRQPGPEVGEQLSAYQHNLKEKTRQMKAMASELNMNQAQVNEYKYEIERISREMQDVKRKYYEHKRREALNRNSHAPQGQATQQATSQATAAHQATTRFAGGGFNLRG